MSSSCSRKDCHQFKEWLKFQIERMICLKTQVGKAKSTNNYQIQEMIITLWNEWILMDKFQMYN